MNSDLEKKLIFKKEFKDILLKANAAPFLFVGSGMSIRYYNIPTWISLLEGFVEIHKKCFKYVFGFYSSNCNGDPTKIASELAKEFNEHWWHKNEFETNRLKYKQIASKNIEMAFKIELCEFIKSKKKIIPNMENEINLLSKATLSGILTTNWDDFLQSIFKDFEIKIGQKEIIFSNNIAVGDIFKIHGCITNPDSIIVTSDDYEKFIKYNHYLNSKILTFFMDYPILLIGYSLSDPNIERILKNIVDCLNNEMLHYEKLQDRLLFVEWQETACNPSIESSTYNLNSVSIPIKKIKVHNYINVFEVLSEIPRRLSVSILRQLKGMVYDFVISSEASNKIIVNGLENLDKIENLEVVVGFGNITKLQDKGIIGLKDIDLVEDILFNKIDKGNYKEIVEKLLPSIVKKNVFTPFFKYQKETGNLNKDNSLKDFFSDNFTLNRSKSINLEDYRLKSQMKSIDKHVKKSTTIEDIINNNDFNHAIQRIPFLQQNKIDTKVLRKFLRDNWEKIDPKNSYFSQYRKCVCLLDFLENGNKK